jgi:acetyltransferase
MADHVKRASTNKNITIVNAKGLMDQILAGLLMQTILEYARSEGLRRIEGQVLNENTTMLTMCRELGFSISADPHDPGSSLVRLELAPKAEREPVIERT